VEWNRSHMMSPMYWLTIFCYARHGGYGSRSHDNAADVELEEAQCKNTKQTTATEC
jgi:hypothetical protein